MAKSSKETKDYSAQDKAYEEGTKLFYDLFKHMTTISTGSILILAAFLEKVFKNPVWEALVGVTFGGFILLVVTAILMMFFISNMIRNFGRTTRREEVVVSAVSIITVASFICGIITLVIFALKNLHQ